MKIVFSGTMLRYVDYNKEIQVEATNISEAVQAIISTYPGAKNILLDGTGNVRSIHRLFLNKEVLVESDLMRPVQARDRLDIVTAIAGG